MWLKLLLEGSIYVNQIENCFLKKSGVGSTLAEVIMVNVFLNFFDSSTCSRRTLSSS